MSWLAQLKNATHAKADPTEPTEPGFVGSVGRGLAPFAEIQAVAGAELPDPPNADAYCWPHSPAWNSSEIDTFMARVAMFTNKGMSVDDADTLADRLVQRDRDLDDRRVCMECVHLSGGSDKALSCKNWKRAGMVLGARAAQLSIALVHQLQRCNGFNGA